MKAIQFLGMTAFMAAMLTGCSNDSDLAHSNFPDDNIIRVTAGVNGAVTRAETVAPLNSNFSLTVVNKAPLKVGERYSTYSYGNKFFQKNGSEWICSTPLLWQDADTKVDVAALAPAIDEMTFNGIYNYMQKIQTLEYSISDNQETQKPVNKNDLLYYYQSDLVPRTALNSDGKLDIQFNHAFSMIDINVTLGTEYSNKNNPINKVIVGGSKLKATVDVTNSNGVAYASTKGENPETDIITTPGEFTMATTDHSTAKFSCILIPQKIEANKFKVTLMTSSKTYVWTSPVDITLQTGHRYTLNLTMGKDVVTAQNGNISAGSWTEGTDSGSTLGTK